MTPSELKMRLLELNLSQKRLAEMLDYTPDSVTRWVKGKLPIPAKVVEALDAMKPYVDPDDAAPVIVPQVERVHAEPAKPSGRTTEHAPGHIANSTPVPHVGDIVRVAPPHGGPWMQVRWIEDGVYNCWWDQDGVRFADVYAVDDLETLYADRLAAGVQWPPKGNIVAMPISTFKASKPVSKPQRDGVYRFGILYAD